MSRSTSPARAVTRTPLVLAALCLTALLGGCETTVGRFTILSTKYNEISRVDLTRIEYHHDVQGAEGRVWILFIPIGSAPTIERVVDDCLAKGFGDFMTSARIDSFWWSCLFVSYESYRVKGDVGNSVGSGSRTVGPQSHDSTSGTAPTSGYEGSGRR